jgi:hypothetical protein
MAQHGSLVNGGMEVFDSETVFFFCRWRINLGSMLSFRSRQAP